MRGHIVTHHKNPSRMVQPPREDVLIGGRPRLWLRSSKQAKFCLSNVYGTEFAALAACRSTISKSSTGIS